MSFISVDLFGIRCLIEGKSFSKVLWEADGAEVPSSTADAVVVLIKGVT